MDQQRRIFVTEILLGIGMLGSAFATGYFWKALGELGSGNAIFDIPFYLEIISIFLFAILFSLSSIILRDRRIWIAGIGGSSAIIFMPYRFQEIFLGGMVAAFCLFLWGFVAMRKTADSQARLHWYSILRAGIKKFFTGISVVFAVLFFAVLGSSATLQEAVIPKPVFHALLPMLEKPAQGLVPGFSADGTLDEAILHAVKTQLKDVDISKVPNVQVRQFIAEQRTALNRQFGTRFTGKEKVSDVLYSVVSKKLSEYAAPYKHYIPAALSVGYFITMQFVFAIFSWILYVIFPILILALVSIGFLERKSGMVEKEVITL